MKWILQNNLINENDSNQLQQSCKNIGVKYEEIFVIPFSEELPMFHIDEDNIYFGSTTFINNVYIQLSPNGVFFNSDFKMSSYTSHWKNYMLSSEGSVTTFKELFERVKIEKGTYFIRPDSDSKIFAGEVLKYDKIEKWYNELQKLEGLLLLSSIPLWVCEPHGIEKEWRNLVVNGKVITSSLYRTNFRLTKSSTDIPNDMIKFVEDRCKEWMPHDVFAMDIALSGGNFYIIECGCANSIGFYHMDIQKYIESITNYMKMKGKN